MTRVSWVCKICRGVDARVLFPPAVVVEVKALAGELPRTLGVPLSRLSMRELGREAIGRGIVAEISGTTLWRWLSEDAIRPWRHRSWIFPQDPAFFEKAGRVLALYERSWEGKLLGPHDYVVSADEKTSVQARLRRETTLPPGPHEPMRVEHEYMRQGAWTYLAAWDVHRARIFGRCESKSGIAAFDRLVRQVMSEEPYASARRGFWILDNGSSHRGERSVNRLCAQWPTIVPVHLPTHASWLNQIEIYFSIVQRKVLTPNDFSGLAEVEERLRRFQDRYQDVAQPFAWKFTRTDLARLLDRLNNARLRHHSIA